MTIFNHYVFHSGPCCPPQRVQLLLEEAVPDFQRTSIVTSDRKGGPGPDPLSLPPSGSARAGSNVAYMQNTIVFVIFYESYYLKAVNF